MKNEINLEKILSEKFLELSERTLPPEELKIEVLRTIDRIKYLSEIIDLFTIKFVQSEIDLVTGNNIASE